MNPLFEVQDLRVYHGTRTVPVRAVDGVSFTIEKGETLGLAGESGCGKSTLATGMLKLISPPTYIPGGKVLFRGKDLLAMDDDELREIRWKHIALLPQAAMNALNPVMRNFKQLIDAMEAHGVDRSKKEWEKYVEELMKSVALSPQVAKDHPCELSGGMKQRTIIAMAIAMNPDLIVADEPTSALDVVVQRGVLELLVESKEKTGASLLFVSHDIAVISEIADRLAIIYAGKIMEIQNIYDLFGDPLHPYTQALIASVPSLEKRGILESIPGLPPDLRNPLQGCRFHPRCSYAREVCAKEEPEFKEIEPRKFVACHNYS